MMGWQKCVYLCLCLCLHTLSVFYVCPCVGICLRMCGNVHMSVSMSVNETYVFGHSPTLDKYLQYLNIFLVSSCVSSSSSSPACIDDI